LIIRAKLARDSFRVLIFKERLREQALNYTGLKKAVNLFFIYFLGVAKTTQDF
jgi:hypothetical protein